MLCCTFLDVRNYRNTSELKQIRQPKSQRKEKIYRQGTEDKRLSSLPMLTKENLC